MSIIYTSFDRSSIDKNNINTTFKIILIRNINKHEQRAFDNSEL